VDQWLDWSAFGFLALLTLLDGLRRVPAGAFVLRKVMGGRWMVTEQREGYALVSWWPPLSTSLVVGGTAGGRDGGTIPASQVEYQLKAVRGKVRTLAILGGLSLFALLVGVPVSMRWLGGMGFLLSLLVVLLLSFLIAVLSFLFTQGEGASTRQRLLFALPRLNPFAAPAAGEALLERTLSGANPFASARGLMTEKDFLAWVRPAAYDLATGADNGAVLLSQVIPGSDLQKMLAERPARVGAENPWCPRCGAEFGASTTTCSGCEIPLKT
jgi:hypothetical protein